MTRELYDNGEVFTLQNDLSSTTFEVGLYNDSTDSLSDTATYADITTEPANSYSAQSQSTVTVELDANGNGTVTLDPVTFDVSTSTVTVDSVYIRDSASGDLLWANNIGTQDLNTKDGSLEISNIGFTLN